MNRILKRTLIGFGAVAALGSAAIGYFAFNQLNPALPENLATLGQARLTDKVGSPVALSATVVPRSATLIAFWATWCMPCRSEAREIAALRRQYRTSDLTILYLNVDDVPNAAATASFLRAAHAENLDVLYAGHSGWKTITGSSAMSLPRSYVFDRTGKASAVFAGFDPTSSKRDLARSLVNALNS